MYSPTANAVAAKLGLKMGRANLEEFAATLLALAKTDRDILAVASDSPRASKLAPFGEALPNQIIKVGVAEQNLVRIAADLGSSGKNVFAVSPAKLLTSRCLDQIKSDVCFHDHPVTLVGISANVSYGALGRTHPSLHDFAALRSINNITIVVPADNYEASEAVKAAAAHDKPVYLRVGKSPLYTLPCAGTAPFALGRARVLRQGKDVAFISTGEAVIHSLLAAAHLEATMGMSCRVLSLPTLKPLDFSAILAAACDCRAVITVEEHMVNGGLGEAVAAIIAEAGIGTRFVIVGIRDEYTASGSQAHIFRHYGLSMEGLVDTAMKVLG